MSCNRLALVVGIDNYESPQIANLSCCVSDAQAMCKLLSNNQDGALNFECKVLTAPAPSGGTVERGRLKGLIVDLFSKPAEVALLYYSGHGFASVAGGYIMASNCDRGDEGVPLSEVLACANDSPARHKVIIVDSCHSGAAGELPGLDGCSMLGNGVTIMTACRRSETALEGAGYGTFTSLLVDALEGSAANLIGEITPGSIYAYVDKVLGLWEQRPVFKTNTEEFISLRQVAPRVPLADLRKLPELFPSPDYEFPLDPSYEPRDEARTVDMPPADSSHIEVFALLQGLNRNGLVVPFEAPHMWHAAMEGKGCVLTRQGKVYRDLVIKGRV